MSKINWSMSVECDNGPVHIDFRGSDSVSVRLAHEDVGHVDCVAYWVYKKDGVPQSSALGPKFTVRNVATNQEKVEQIVLDVVNSEPLLMDMAKEIVGRMINAKVIKED